MKYIYIYIYKLSYLDLITDIDNKGIGDGIDSNPLAIFEDLQSWHVILEEHGDDIRIGMAR